MKAVLLQENLRKALNHAAKALPSKPQLAILSSILLEASSTHIELAATDLYVGIRSKVLGTIEEPGSVVVPGKIFQELITSLPPGKITLSTQGATLIIQSESGTTKIQTQDSSEYPPFPTLSGQTYQLTAEQLQIIDTRVKFCAGIDPTRVVLTALLFRFGADELEVVGTDGFRLAIQKFEYHSQAEPSQLLLPAKAIGEIARIALQEAADTITLVVSTELKQVLCVLNDTEIFIRLIDGDFPPYQKIVPDSFAITTEWEGEAFLSQLKRAMIFARESSNIIRLSLSQEQLSIQANSSAFGEYQGSLPLEMTQGADGHIAFNAKYLLDFMSALKPEKIWFGMNESLKPAQFKVAKMDNFFYIVMPFRVTE